MSLDSSTFLLNPTKLTPYVEFDYQDGKLDIIGKKAPDSSPEFYKQINYRIKEFLAARGQALSVNISFEDCDTSANDDFLDLLKALKPDSNQKEISVNWYYYGDEKGKPKSLETQMNELGIAYRKYSYNL